MYHLILTRADEVRVIIISVLQMEKLRHREGKELPMLTQLIRGRVHLPCPSLQAFLVCAAPFLESPVSALSVPKQCLAALFSRGGLSEYLLLEDQGRKV